MNREQVQDGTATWPTSDPVVGEIRSFATEDGTRVLVMVVEVRDE